MNTEDLFFDIELNIDPDIPNPALTPFNAYYSQSANISHVEISTGVIDWTGAELPKSRVNLLNVLSETYNYGHLITLIPDVTITQTGILRINNNGPTGYLNGAEAEQQFFHAYTHAACDADITVQDGGQFILGSEAAPYRHGVVHVEDGSTVYVQTGGTLKVKRSSDLILESGSHLELSGLLEATFGGQVIIRDGASLRVENGGTLQMIHSSNLVVEKGGRLIIEDGAIINLWDNSDHRANISVFGELVINGQLSIGGSGHFKFNQGNEITFGPNVSAFAFEGNTQTHRFFIIGENATLAFGEMPFRLTRGIIEYEAGSTISAVGAPYVSLLAIGLVGTNRSGTGITTSSVNQVDIRYCNFSNLGIGFSSSNEDTGTVFLQGSDFNNCQYGLINGGFERVDIFSSNFSGEGPERPEVSGAMILIGNKNVRMTSTNISDYDGPNYKSDYQLNAQEGTNHPAISLSHDGAITNLSMYQCLVRDNKIGVLLDKGTNGFSDGNIFVRNKTTFQDNETGILMWRGRHHEREAGLVLLDCARLIDNGVGVRGIDVLLQMDAIENCLECEDIGNPQTQIRPNTFTSLYQFDGPVNIFDICYQNFEVIGIPAKGNYWDGDLPVSDTPVGEMWRFRENEFCNGFINDNILTENPFIATRPIGCPDETIDTGCPPEQICDINPPGDKKVFVEIEGHMYNLHSQYAAAYQDFRNENLTQSKERFMPIAGIPNEIKNSLNGVGKHYVDVARVMVNALQNSNQAGVNSEDSYNDTYGHLWVPGAIQTLPEDLKKDVSFTVYPNPANNQVMIEATPNAYELSVYNVLGNPIHRITMDHRISLDVTKWAKGVYTVELKEEGNFKNRMIQKLIIQ